MRNDQQLIRELARQYRELAELPINQERKRRCRNINDCIPDRPPVWINEVPWNEMNIGGELTLQCGDPFCREMEWFFREKLFRWKYFQADMVLDPEYPMAKRSTSTGIGVEAEERILATDRENHIVSHQYTDLLDAPEKVEQLCCPVITAHPEEDRRRKEQAEELLGGILPVRLHGSYVYYAPWDQIARLRSVEPIYMDMVDRPELLHAIMAKFLEIGLSILDQMEAQDLLDWNCPDLHCTPPYVTGLPAADFDGKVRAKDIWFRGMAQMLSSVSPAMFEEFELDYMKPLFARCGLVYYGCCEPLDNRIPLLKTVPNLRKIGVSPWADIRKCAEQIGSRYVYARKPNPAAVAMTVDAEAVKKEITATLQVCREYGCACEFVLKDISTVGHRPQNLIDWNRAAQEAIDEFYR